MAKRKSRIRSKVSTPAETAPLGVLPQGRRLKTTSISQDAGRLRLTKVQGRKLRIS